MIAGLDMAMKVTEISIKSLENQSAVIMNKLEVHRTDLQACSRYFQLIGK